MGDYWSFKSQVWTKIKDLGIVFSSFESLRLRTSGGGTGDENAAAQEALLSSMGTAAKGVAGNQRIEV